MRALLAAMIVCVGLAASAQDCPDGYTCTPEDCPTGYICEDGAALPLVPEYGPWWLQMVQAVLDGIAGLWEQFLCALKNWFCWIVETAGEFGVGLIEGLAVVFPDLSEFSGAIAAAVNWLGLANMFLPLGEAFAMVLTYSTFVIAVIIVKWVLKLIPTIG